MTNTNNELKIEELDAASGGNYFNDFNNAAVAATNPGLTLAIGAMALCGVGLGYCISTPRTER